MKIITKTIYLCNGKTFEKLEGLEGAIDHCNERLAEFIDTVCLLGVVLSPKDRLTLLKNIKDLSAKDRDKFSNLIQLYFEGDEV